MATELILELLTKQSGTRLRQMRTQADAEIQRLQFEINYIDRALAEKSGASASQSKQNAEPASASDSGGRRESKRGPIKEIAQSEPAKVWRPAEIRQCLALRGIEITNAAARVTMRRMLDEGTFQRGPDGEGFQLASRNGSHLGDRAEPQETVFTEPLLTATGPQKGN